MEDTHHQPQIQQSEHRDTASDDPRRATATKPCRKAKVKWPKASEKDEWRSFDESLHTILQNALKGNTIAKLNIFGDIIYEEGKARFGELQQRKNLPKQSGRREREIHQLLKERRLLRKAWRRSEDHEKEGLKNLWDRIRAKLGLLRRAERIRRRSSRKERARSSFFRDPFKYARGLLEEKKTGTLHTTEWELEDHIKTQTSDDLRESPLGPPGYIPKPPEPSSMFDTTPPEWSKINQVVARARATSAAGPNGVSYKVYKNCPMTLRFLWKKMSFAWKTKSIPPAWCKAITTFKRKTPETSTNSEALRF